MSCVVTWTASGRPPFSDLSSRNTRGKRRSEIMQINGRKGGEIGPDRGIRTTAEVKCLLNYRFNEREIPVWSAACRSVNNKNISVPKDSSFHCGSNFRDDTEKTRIVKVEINEGVHETWKNFKFVPLRVNFLAFKILRHETVQTVYLF